ncbi:MAG: fibronectin type III domain-containing protein [Acidimicrobiales bacterium]
MRKGAVEMGNSRSEVSHGRGRSQALLALPAVIGVSLLVALLSATGAPGFAPAVLSSATGSAPLPSAAGLSPSSAVPVSGPGWQRSLVYPGSLSAVSCVSAEQCVAVGGEGPMGLATVMVTADGGASWLPGSVVGGIESLSAVSCSGAKLCVALGASSANSPVGTGGTIIASSDNGGATWGIDPLPAGLGGGSSVQGQFKGQLQLQLDSVSCAAATTCMVVGSITLGPPSYMTGGIVLVSTDSGQVWSEQPGVPAVSALSSVSCPVAGSCFAIGQGGGPAGPFPPFDDQVSSILSTADNGQSWSAQTRGGYLASVSCISESSCTAVGSSIVDTSDGGATWSTAKGYLLSSSGFYFPGTSGVNAVSCLSAGRCVAAVLDILGVTSDGGETWSLPAVPPVVTHISGVSCPTTSLCTAVGASGDGPAILESGNGGGTWALAGKVPGTYGLKGISCPTISQCMAVGGLTALSTQDAGGSWQPMQVSLPEPSGVSGESLTGAAYLTSVSCPVATRCIAVGSTGPTPAPAGSVALAYAGSIGGTSLQPVPLPAGLSGLGYVSCAGTATCVATGTTVSGQAVILASNDAGASWQLVSLPTGVTYAGAVSCVSGADCMAVGSGTAPSASPYPFGVPPLAMLSSTDGGLTWSVELSAPSFAPGYPFKFFFFGAAYSALSCPSTTVCVADIDGVIFRTSNGGRTFQGVTDVVGIPSYECIACGAPPSEVGVSCSSVEDCMVASPALGTVVTTDGGLTWYAQRSSAGARSVSCPSASDCFATARLEVITTTDGGVSEPGAPSSVDAKGTQDAAIVRWKAPSDLGGGPVESYTVTAMPGSASVTVPGGSLVAVVRGLADGTGYTFAVRATNVAGPGPSSPSSNTVVPTPGGYWLASSQGRVYAFGAAKRGGGSLPGIGVVPAAPVVGIASTPDGHGYWLAGADGGVFSFGTARFFGSIPGSHVPRFGPVVGIASTPDGHGYWLVSSDGFVYRFGDAGYFGPVDPAKAGVRSVVGIASTPDGHGYWLVSSDGAVYAFGDATSRGSLAGKRADLTSPVVGIASTPDGHGYWLVSSDGKVYPFGTAVSYGSPAPSDLSLSHPVVGIASTPDGHGYWLVSSDGAVYAFGDAGFFGSLPAAHLGSAWGPVVGMAAFP